MTIKYHVRFKCSYDNEWEYIRLIQTGGVDPSVVCHNHPSNQTEDFIVESVEDIEDI